MIKLQMQVKSEDEVFHYLENYILQGMQRKEKCKICSLQKDAEMFPVVMAHVEMSVFELV